MSTPKLSPQEARKRMIQLMAKWMLTQNEWTNIEDFKKLFMYNTGASRTKTDEYFDLCEPRITNLEFRYDSITGTKQEAFRVKPKEETKTETKEATA